MEAIVPAHVLNGRPGSHSRASDQETMQERGRQTLDYIWRRGGTSLLCQHGAPDDPQRQIVSCRISGPLLRPRW